MNRTIVAVGTVLVVLMLWGWSQWGNDTEPSIRIFPNMSEQVRGTLGKTVPKEMPARSLPAQLVQQTGRGDFTQMGSDYFHTGKRLTGYGNTVPGEILVTGSLSEHSKRADRLYRNHCSTCHGDKGDGQGTMALMQGYPMIPAFQDSKYERMVLGRIFYSISNGQGNMPEFGSRLSVSKLWELSLKVRELSQRKEQ